MAAPTRTVNLVILRAFCKGSIPGDDCMYWRYFASTAVALLCSVVCHAETNESSNALAHDIFKELIEINTTESVGRVTSASEAMAKRFRDAGFAPADMQ